MKTTKEMKQEIKVAFEEIVERCETIGDLIKLHNEVMKLNKEIGK